MAWLGRIAAAFTPGAVPALENVTSMFIQAMDLSPIVPLCVGGVLLLRRSAWGYLLASVGTIELLVEELETLRRDVIRADKLTLIGHSAGGALALRYAIAHPDRVEKLVLVYALPVDGG